MSNLLRMDYINSLPQPFTALLYAHADWWWPIYDIAVDAGICRIRAQPRRARAPDPRATRPQRLSRRTQRPTKLPSPTPAFGFFGPVSAGAFGVPAAAGPASTG